MKNIKIILYSIVFISNFLSSMEAVQELSFNQLNDLLTTNSHDDFFLLISTKEIRNSDLINDKTIPNLDIILDTLSQTNISVKKIYYSVVNNSNDVRFKELLASKSIGFFYSNKNHLNEYEGSISDTYSLFKWISNKYSVNEKNEISTSVIDLVEKRLNINEEKRCKADFIGLINESISSLDSKFKALESRLLSLTLSKNKKLGTNNNNQYFGILLMFVFILVISATIVVYLKLRKINKVSKIKNNII